MKINLIGQSFDKNSGQGIYRYSSELFERLQNKNLEVVKNIKGDIDHVQQPELIWKALFKKNVITTFHDIMPFFNNERKFLFRVFFYFSSLLASIKSKKIIAVSQCTKKDIIKYFPFTKNKIIVIYEGVDKNEFYRIKNKKKNKIFTIGYIGGLGKRKNIEFILKLAEKMKNERVLFKIAGKGSDKERLLKISQELELKNIVFVGFILDEKINEFYNSLDLFIFPSLYEGFGLPVVEAMACGIPCLISDRGSLPEIIGNAGKVIDIDNLLTTTVIIKSLIKNKRGLKRSIKRANYFNWDKTIKDTIKVYEKILK